MDQLGPFWACRPGLACGDEVGSTTELPVTDSFDPTVFRQKFEHGEKSLNYGRGTPCGQFWDELSVDPRRSGRTALPVRSSPRVILALVQPGECVAIQPPPESAPAVQ